MPTIIGSESRISRLFLNIIVNAAQAVASDVEKDHFIRIVTRNDAGRHIVVDVVDSGPGIPSENLERLFEPFFTTKAASQGTGLGLSICREIVEDLGGSISVESVVGSGSTFRVTLPVRAAERITDHAPTRDRRRQPSPRRLPRCVGCRFASSVDDTQGIVEMAQVCRATPSCVDVGSARTEVIASRLRHIFGHKSRITGAVDAARRTPFRRWHATCFVVRRTWGEGGQAPRL